MCALGPWLRAPLAFLGALAVRFRGSAFSRCEEVGAGLPQSAG